MTGFRWLLLALAGLAPALRGAEDAAVALPPFLVEETAKGPPWRYTEAMGYEILARCNDATTQRVVAAHYVLHQLLAEILPPALQLEFTVPKALILYDEELSPAASQEVIARMMRDTTPLPELDVAAGFRRTRASAAARPTTFLPNLRLFDRDAMTVFMIVRQSDFASDRLALTSDYVSYLVKGRLPALPLWFVQGFLAVYRQIEFTGTKLTLEPLEWISEQHTHALKKDPATAPRPQPLAEFLTHRLPEPGPGASYEPIQAWQSMAQLFVRWGLDPGGGERRAAFWRFVDRTAAEGPSEKLFRECFHLDYAAAEAEIAAFLPGAVRRATVFQPMSSPKLPPLIFRDATAGQISRLKGDWERLEIAYVKNLFPAVADKYLAQARRTLHRAYDRDDRDPRLLAVLGLCEVDAGNAAGARDFLESAAALGPLRPRANYELARLRLAQAQAQPEGTGRRLDIAQTAQVLQPLFAARGERPLLPEVYELIADAWAASAATPTRAHLAVLTEGVHLFPRRSGLVLRAAELHLQHGFRDEAAALVEIAVRIVDDEASRQRLAALQQALAPH